MKHDPKALQFVLETASPRVEVLSFKPIFGGIMAYADGRSFASLSDVGLALNWMSQAATHSMKVKGAKPLQYQPGAPMSKLRHFACRHAPDTEALAGWVARSAEYVLAAAAKPKRARSPTPNKPQSRAARNPGSSNHAGVLAPHAHLSSIPALPSPTFAL